MTTANASQYGGHYDPAAIPHRGARLPHQRYVHPRPFGVLCVDRVLRQETTKMKKLAALIIALTALIPAMGVVSPVEARTDWLCPKYTKQIKQAFPREVWRTMDAIMWRESRCIPKAVGWNYRSGQSHRDCRDSGKFHARRRCPAVRSWDTGLFQINSSWNTLTTQVCGKNTRTKILTNVECNFKVAKMLYSNGGLDHWRGTSNKTERQP
jgi:hypothetical protein